MRSGLMAVVAVILLAGCGKPAEPEAEIRPVRTVVARAESLADLPSQVGEIRPHFESDLGFKIAGKVLSRSVELGTVVKRGDVIARLDEQDQRNQLLAAQADVAAAQAGLTQASAEERRQDQLRLAGWASVARYEAALQARDSARAMVRAAQAKLQLARDQMDYASLRAPEDGVVTQVNVEAGQVVGAGQMVVRLARLDRKDAVFSIAEGLLLTAPHDPLVEVWSLDAPELQTTGRVTEISPSADPVTRTFTVKVALPDAPATMRFGMTVVGRIHMAERRVISLPSSALFQQNGQPALWVVDPVAMTISLIPVGVFRLDPERVLVADGLGDGALVVTAGLQKLRPGQKVRLLPEANGSAP